MARPRYPSSIDPIKQLTEKHRQFQTIRSHPQKLFATFNHHLEAKGYIARGGQIIDATIVNAPKQRNSRDENEAIKSGETPAG